MSSSSRSQFLPLAGLILVLDGLVAWLLGGVVLLMSTAVAAIEGRTGNANGHLLWWGLGLFLAGIVAFAAAWRALRGRQMRLGALVAGGGALAAAYAVWSSATTSPLDVRAFAVSGAILLAQLVAMLLLVTRREAGARPSTPNHR